jgi:predicted CXXCH cytochrome family protein
MPLEWSVAGLLLAAALWPLVRKTRSWSARAGLTFLIGATALGGFAWKSRAHSKVMARQQFRDSLPAEHRAGGYAKSDACRSCHPDQYASWHRSYHRTMTQRATPEAVRGAFNDVTLTLENEVFHLSRRGDEFWIEMFDPDWKYLRAFQQEDFERGRGPKPNPEPNPPRVGKRVTLTTGSHHMQAYWVAGKYGNQQFNFPFTYLFEEERWVPRNDVFMLPRGTPHLQQVWNRNCLGCHSTAGQPQQDPKSFVLNSRAAEFGIACEACHGPAEKHLQANKSLRRRYARHRGTNVDPTITNPARVSAKKASEICSQCHAARAVEDQEEWYANGLDYWHRANPTASRPLMPGKDLQLLTDTNDPKQVAAHRSLSGYFWNDGMIRVSGREYNGLSETPCFQKGDLSCLSCHSMHKMVSADDQLALGMESNRACYQCHAGFEKKLAQHTHHAANSSGSLCYNCHMPHTTYGLLKAIRSHQITSPSVNSSIETGRPNACNLCHLDRTLPWTAKQLNAWYRQPIPVIEPAFTDAPASATWLLRGDAGQRALVAWHMGWDTARQASGTNWLVPYLAETLDDPYSVVRYIGQRSLKRLPGFEHLSYDFIAPNEQRLQSKSRVLQRWDSNHLPVQERSKVLLPQQMSQLLEQRDQRPVELFE